MIGIIVAVVRRLGLNQRFATPLSGDSAVCGVSAAITITRAIGMEKESTTVTIATVVLWAIAMIFALPSAARLLGLPKGGRVPGSGCPSSLTPPGSPAQPNRRCRLSRW